MGHDKIIIRVMDTLEKNMERYNYYTPIELAECILKLIPDVNVGTIIDICCGSWNLLKAAKNRYPTAKVYGVDVDTNSQNHKLGDALFYKEDGREFALDMKNARQTYDLILSNPPFGYLQEENRKYNSNECVYAGCYSGLINKRYEGEMVQANMFLAHINSVLVFILPNTFVEGDSLKKARCQIANDYQICNVIKLPNNTFERGLINTFAIIMKKGSLTNSSTKLYEAKNNGNWELLLKGELSYNSIIKGDWWDTISAIEKNVDIHLCRGNLSSNYFVDCGEMVFHNASKVGEIWKPSVRYFDVKSVHSPIIRARQGDILVNRVGKGAGYWWQNTFTNVAVSDCIIIVENKIDDLLERFKKSSNSDGRLKVPIHGVATPYLTAKDLRNVILSYEC